MPGHYHTTDKNITAFEQQLNDILQGDIWTDQMETYRHGRPEDNYWAIFARNKKRQQQLDAFKNRSRKFDAMTNLGTSFASGLKLKKAEKKFRSGQSSLFIQ